MKKLIAVLLGVLLGLSVAASAEIIKLKSVVWGTDKLAATDKSSGQALWTSATTTQKTVSNGKTFLVITDVGSGIYGKDKKNQSWRSEAFYNYSGNVATPYQTTLAYKDQSGKTISTINKYYDPKSRQILVKYDGRQKTFDLYDDLIDKELLGVSLGNYPFAQPRDLQLHLLTNEPTLYSITIKYRGRETQNGQDCYKIEMIPDLGALNIFGAFVPKTYFWYTVSSPHKFVRYEGLESGLGTPYIVLRSE